MKFSRLLTCFSMVAALYDPGQADHPDKAIQLVKTPPLKRLETVVVRHGLDEPWQQMRELYGWFLQATDKEPREAEEWIAAREVRSETFPKAERFGDLMFDLLVQVAHKSGTSLRYLVV